MILDKAYTKSQARGIESWSQGTTSAIKYVTARYKNSFPFNFLLYNNFISNLFKKTKKTKKISATWVHYLAQGYFGT